VIPTVNTNGSRGGWAAAACAASIKLLSTFTKRA